MLGLPTVSRGNSLGLAAADAHFNQSHYNWFVNDDWKLGPNLTMNLGLRWEQPRPAYYEGSADGSFSTDYHYCAVDYSQAQGRIDPVQLMPRGLDIAQWQGPEGLALEFQNLDRRGCHEAKWRFFAPRFGLAWRLFGTNRTVLRFGTGLTYDQDFGPAGNRRMLQVRGMLEGFQPPQTEVPTLILGERLELPSQQLSEYRTCYFSELDREEGQVYSYNLSIQHELFPATKLEVGYAGNQGRHLRNFRAFNVALPEGYVVPLIGGGTTTMTSDPITAPPRPWIEGDTQERTWSGQQARRPYPQLRPQPVNHADGNSTYNSLQVKLERRFQDGVAVSTGYTWSKAMALNCSGRWGQWFDFRAYERHALKAPMPHDRSQTFYNSTIWELPFFRHSKGMTRTLLGGWQATTLITLTTGRSTTSGTAEISGTGDGAARYSRIASTTATWERANGASTAGLTPVPSWLRFTTAACAKAQISAMRWPVGLWATPPLSRCAATESLWSTSPCTSSLPSGRKRPWTSAWISSTPSTMPPSTHPMET